MNTFPNDPSFGKPLAPLVLPAVYDDVLSYEEWLSKVIYQVNQLTDYINDTMTHLYENIDSYVDAGVASRMQAITDQVNALNTKLNEDVANLQEQIDNIETDTKDYVDEKVDTLSRQVNEDLEELQRAVTDAIEECKDYCDHNTQAIDERVDHLDAKLSMEIAVKMASVNQRIDDIIKEYPTLYNPATGFKEDMQTLVFHMYNALRCFGIEALKYDDQELTAEQYDGKAIRAVKYDTDMLRILCDKIKSMFNPFTGELSSTEDVVDYLIKLLKWNAKTASQYDGYQTSAQDFDNSTFGAYAQDTNQYITGTTPDVKNKAYENYLLLTTELTEGNAVAIPTDAFNIRFELADKCYTIPADGVNVTIDGVTVYANNSHISVENGTIDNVFAITPVKDVSELDK